MIRVQWVDNVEEMMFDDVAVREVIEEHGKDILRRGSNTIVIDDEDTEVTVKISTVVEMLNSKSNEEPMTIVHCRILNVKLL